VACFLASDTRQQSKPQAASKRTANSLPRPLLVVTQEESRSMHKLLPYPLFILFSIIAFNVTAFTVILQLDMLIIDATIYKVIAWLVTAGSWTIVYINRNR
jgi:hypothetical protein